MVGQLPLRPHLNCPTTDFRIFLQDKLDLWHQQYNQMSTSERAALMGSGQISEAQTSVDKDFSTAQPPIQFIFSKLAKKWIHGIYLIAIFVLLLSVVNLNGKQTETNKRMDLLARQNEAIRQNLNKQTEIAQKTQDIHIDKFYDFRNEIAKVNTLIERIQNTSIQHQWLLPQKIFHHYQVETRIMYFQTAYDIILPSCQLSENYRWSLDRENIFEWNKNTEVAEWALRYVREGDRVLYYRPKVFNLLELTIISKIVGANGSITIFDSGQITTCMGQIIDFQALKAKIEYSSIDKLESFVNYTVLITNETLLETSKFKKMFIPTVRSLIYVDSPPNMIISKLSLAPAPFAQPFFSHQPARQGFYSIIPQGVQPSSRPLFKQNGNFSDIRSLVQSEYGKFKQEYKNGILQKKEFLVSLVKNQQCYDVNSTRIFKHYVTTIYGHRLYDVSLEQLEGWERERQAVEWVRSHLANKTNRNVYYQIMQKFNLLAIIEISLLIAPQSLTVVCYAGQCERIAKQIQENRLVNIQTIANSDRKKALTAGLIITNSESIITSALYINFLLNGSLLGQFSYTLPNSLAHIRRLYVHHNLREVVLDAEYNECIGMSYRHFFWSSWQPEGFYDITPSGDVIYAFWGGHPSNLNIRKKLLIEEVTTATLQFKILNPDSFLAFEKPESPIHPAFYLLTTIQKSDYLRVYLMHHYGGGYTDVKHIHFDMRAYMERFNRDEDKLAMGYAEKSEGDVPCFDDRKPSCAEIRSRYTQLIGNGCYFFKKQTVITTEWFNRMTNNLSDKLQALKKNPPRVPRQELGHSYLLANGSAFTSKYPFRWAEIANEHLARVQYKHLDRISTALPYIINVDYRVENNLMED